MKPPACLTRPAGQRQKVARASPSKRRTGIRRRKPRAFFRLPGGIRRPGRRVGLSCAHKKGPRGTPPLGPAAASAARVWRLAIPYFRTAKCRTIIGARRFHFRVRDGSGWFTPAMVTKQFGVPWPAGAVRPPGRPRHRVVRQALGLPRKPVRSSPSLAARPAGLAHAFIPSPLGVIGSSLTGN